MDKVVARRWTVGRGDDPRFLSLTARRLELVNINYSEYKLFGI